MPLSGSGAAAGAAVDVAGAMPPAGGAGAVATVVGAASSANAAEWMSGRQTKTMEKQRILAS
jgi:hypothetical protein